MDTLFKQENMSAEVPIEGDEDVVLVLRDKDGKQDFILHLPPFEGDNKTFPPHVGTGVAIAACLYQADEEFQEMIARKFKQYAKEYLDQWLPLSDERKK